MVNGFIDRRGFIGNSDVCIYVLCVLVLLRQSCVYVLCVFVLVRQLLYVYLFVYLYVLNIYSQTFKIKEHQ